MAMAKSDMGGQVVPSDDTPAAAVSIGQGPLSAPIERGEASESRVRTLRRWVFNAIHMGGEVRLTFYEDSSSVAEESARAAFARYADLEQVMSDYRPSSELMRLCALAGSGPVEVSSDLYKVLAYSLDVSRHSYGAFDVTASPVVRLWREARRTGVMPTPDVRKSALEKVGYQKVSLSALHQTVTLHQPDIQLDLGGIAKGYANDEALKVFSQYSVASAMVEAGGDISVSGAPPETLGWVIKVRGQTDPIYLSHASVSTSGDAEQFVVIDGARYSHVVDPRTGIGVTNRVQATVVAPDGLTTDPWATALCVDPCLKPVGSFSSWTRVQT